MLAHAQDRTVEEDVLATGQFRVEAGAHFEQTARATLDADGTGGGRRDARHQLQQRALTRAVATDHPNDLALLDLEIDPAQGQEELACTLHHVLLADGYARIGPAVHFGPPSLDVLGERGTAEHAQAVLLVYVGDADRNAFHRSNDIGEGALHPVEDRSAER